MTPMLHKKDGKIAGNHCQYCNYTALKNMKLLRSMFLFFAAYLMTGCSLMHLNRQTASTDDFNLLAGYVHCVPSHTGTIIVAAYAQTNDKLNIASSTILHQPGPYELMVPKGRYYVFAFEDNNTNQMYDKGETVGYYGHRTPRLIKADRMIIDLDMVICAENAATIDIPFGFAVAKDNSESMHNGSVGKIANLEDDFFSEKYGAKGYWTPKDFFREIGANIFFIEEYDPYKLPILFIHGANGSPREWQYFIENIDRTRFQPWFFYYPSGASLKFISDLLFWKLLNLKAKYHFGDLYITAHSMGGLVARSFVMDFGNTFPVVHMLISISTPWGGDKLASFGAKHSPMVIPCWKDLAPEGTFLKSLFRSRLPEGIDFYLFFGYKGNRNPLRSNNDGTTSLASLLDLQSQSEANMVIGFNEDHDSILYSKEVLAKYNAILSSEKGVRGLLRKHLRRVNIADKFWIGLNRSP